MAQLTLRNVLSIDGVQLISESLGLLRRASPESRVHSLTLLPTHCSQNFHNSSSARMVRSCLSTNASTTCSLDWVSGASLVLSTVSMVWCLFVIIGTSTAVSHWPRAHSRSGSRPRWCKVWAETQTCVHTDERAPVRH